MDGRRAAAAAGLVLVLAGAGALAGDLALYAKAAVARILVRQSFERHLGDGRLHPPWPWADMAAVARLEVPGRGVVRYVLTGGTGQSLAFDLGHIHGTALPNRPGTCVVTGHRDGRLAFLEDLAPGDPVLVRTAGSTRRYRVDRARVVDAGDLSVLAGQGDGLTLVTCWPFHGLTRSRMRYAVSCVPADGVRYARESGQSIDRSVVPAVVDAGFRRSGHLPGAQRRIGPGSGTRRRPGSS